MNQKNYSIVRKLTETIFFKLKGNTIVIKTGYPESRDRDPVGTRFFMKHGPNGDTNPKQGGRSPLV